MWADQWRTEYLERAFLGDEFWSNPKFMISFWGMKLMCGLMDYYYFGIVVNNALLIKLDLRLPNRMQLIYAKQFFTK